MNAEGALAVIIAMSVPIAILFSWFAGLQRIPWRNAFQIGIGSAIAGALAVRGHERGVRKRDETIATIVQPH